MTDSMVEDLLAAIASLSLDQRRELFSRLGVAPVPSQARQSSLLSDFAANTLVGDADYVVVFDGGSEGNPGRGFGSYAILARGRSEVKRLSFGEDMTNNEAEYATLLRALEDVQARIARVAQSPGEFSLEVRGDSALVLKQVSGEWRARDERMRRLRDSARHALQQFKANRITLQPRAESVRMLGH